MYGYLNIQSDSGLSSLNAFPALTSVGGYLQIYGNAGILSLSSAAFPALTSVGDSIYIYGNPERQSIAGFASLTSVKNYITVDGNAKLVALAGFERLRRRCWKQPCRS